MVGSIDGDAMRSMVIASLPHTPRHPGGNPMTKFIAAVFVGLALAATAVIPAQAVEDGIRYAVRW